MSYDSVVLADSPQAYWKLDETNGSATVADATGNGFTATATGSPTPGLGQASAPGTIGGTTLGLNGAAPPGERYTITPSGALLAALQNHDFSVECLVLRSSSMPSGQFNYFTAGNADTTDQVFQAQYAKATPNYLIGFWSDDFPTGTDPSADAWHHLVFTSANGTKSGIFYVDATPTSPHTFSGNLNVNSSDWAIGGANENWNSWYGNLSRLAVYNTVLTPTQVATHYVASGLAPSSAMFSVLGV